MPDILEWMHENTEVDIFGYTIEDKVGEVAPTCTDSVLAEFEHQFLNYNGEGFGTPTYARFLAVIIKGC